MTSSKQPSPSRLDGLYVVKVFDDALRISASDEANFAACRHLTCLDIAHARGGLSAPAEFDLGFADLVARGERHEAEVLESFRRQGLTVVEIGYEAGREKARPPPPSRR